MKHVIETRLAGSQATQAGVVRFVNRNLSQGPFARVELLYSTQARGRIEPAQARSQIKQLLGEHGMADVAVSARAHGGLLDDASGEHLVRLYPDEPRGPAEAAFDAADAAPQGGIRGWLGRWLRFSQRDPRAPTVEAGITSAEATAHLRAAVAAAVRDKVSRGQHGPWAAAELVVSLPALDASLRPLVMGDLSRAAGSVGQQLAALRQPVADGFALRYSFRTPATGEGTSYSADSDIEVLLHRLPQGAGPTSSGSVQTPALAEAPAPFAPGAMGRIEPRLAAPAPQATLLPTRPEPATLLPRTPARKTLAVRVSGTLDGDFARPLELRFDQLPARIDRDAMARAGLGAMHGELLVTVSNHAALTVRAGVDGGVEVIAARREVPGGESLPMYFDRETLRPLGERTPLPADGLRVVVNDPAGLWDAAGGRRLPALVLDLRMG